MTGAATLRAAYGRLPEEVRRCLRPAALAEEVASFMPAALRDPALALAAMGRRLALLRRVRYRVRRLEGSTAGGVRLVCVLATDEASARFWTRALFVGPPEERVLGVVPALAVPRAAARLDGPVDLALWQASWPVSLLARRAALVPGWVPLWLPTDRPLDAILAGERSGRAARKNAVRRIARLGLAARVARDAASFARFRTRLYEPYVRRRFGELSVPMDGPAFRHARRHGMLLLLEDGGATRAGAVLETHGRELRLRALAAAGADRDAVTLLEACYWHAIGFAVAHRFRRLLLGTTRPLLTDGVLRHKRKWGGRLGAPSTLDRYLLRLRDTRATRAALTAAPLVVQQGRRLRALVGAEGVRLDAHLARLDVPGLDEITVLADGAGGGRVAAPYTPVRLAAPGCARPALRERA